MMARAVPRGANSRRGSVSFMLPPKARSALARQRRIVLGCWPAVIHSNHAGFVCVVVGPPRSGLNWTGRDRITVDDSILLPSGRVNIAVTVFSPAGQLGINQACCLLGGPWAKALSKNELASGWILRALKIPSPFVSYSARRAGRQERKAYAG